MARILTSKVNSSTLTNGYEIKISGGNVSVVTSPVRSGPYAIKTETSVGGDDSVIYQFAEASSTHYFRVYINFPSALSTIVGIINVGKFSGFIDGNALMYLTTSNTLRLEDGGNNLIGTSPALSVDTWYRVELSVSVEGGTTGTLVARVDGSEFASASGTTIENATFDSLLLGGTNDNTHIYYFDDIAINDTSGSTNNSWPGEAPFNNEPGNVNRRIKVGSGMSRSEGAT